VAGRPAGSAPGVFGPRRSARHLAHTAYTLHTAGKQHVSRRKAAARAATRTLEEETAECIGGVRRQVRALAKRVGGLDIEQLAELKDLIGEMTAAYQEAAWLLHQDPDTNPNGYSWQEIADALGITKPTCWRQFGQRRPPRHPGGR